MKNLRMILMSIMTMFMIIGNVNSQEDTLIYEKLGVDMEVGDFETDQSSSVGEFSTYFKVTIHQTGSVKFSGELDTISNYEDVYVKVFGLSGEELSISTSLDINGSNFEIEFKNIDQNKSSEYNITKIELYGTPKDVGLNKNDISNDFNVYTHNNNLIVKTDDYNTQYEVSVHNMNGQMVMSEKNNGQMETYLQVPSGIYIINLITEDGGRLTKKVSIR